MYPEELRADCTAKEQPQTEQLERQRCSNEGNPHLQCGKTVVRRDGTEGLGTDHSVLGHRKKQAALKSN